MLGCVHLLGQGWPGNRASSLHTFRPWGRAVSGGVQVGPKEQSTFSWGLGPSTILCRAPGEKWRPACGTVLGVKGTWRGGEARPGEGQYKEDRDSSAAAPSGLSALLVSLPT